MEISFYHAQREYHNLPHVAVDVLNENMVDDLVFRAQHEIDMHEEGEQRYSENDVRKLRNFVIRWTPHKMIRK